MSIAEFMKGLPCYDADNFSQFNMEHGMRTSQKRPSVYLPTEDYPSEQHIVMDKRCVLLRYLTQQWDKKTLSRKREQNADNSAGNQNGQSAGNSCKKRPRLEALDMN